MKQQENVLQEAFDQLKYVWRHRKGNEVPAAVLDTIDALYKADLKPLVVKVEKKPKSYTFIIHLPAGLSYAEFKRKEHYFEDSTNGAVQIEKRGKVVILEVMTERLQSFYPYQWDWKEYEKMALPVPFGYSALGLIVRDLALSPNLIIAGHPFAGKSNFCHVLAVSLLLARPLHLVIIDLKRLEFAYLKGSALVVTEIEEARKVLMAVNRELDKRLRVLEKAGVVKIQDYTGDMQYIVLIIDELAELQDEQCQELLNRIVRLGRAAGICVVAATQRPSSTMFKKFGDSKAMFAATMCFHVRDEVNSRMLLDNDRAAIIPNIPGRAVYQWERELEVQAMYLPISKARELIKGCSLNAHPMKGAKSIEQPRKRLLPR